MPTDEEIFAHIAKQKQSMTGKPAKLFSLLYGNSGAGKTVLNMQMAQKITPPGKDILYVDTAFGWVSLQNHAGLTDRTDLLNFVSLEQLSAVARAIKAGHEAFANIDTIVLDELSVMAIMDLDSLTRQRAAADRDKDPDAPTWPDRNAGDNRFVRMLYSLVGPVNVMAVAHEREAKSKKNRTITAADFADALREKVKRPMHLVGHVEAVLASTDGEADYRRSIQCHPSQDVEAKSRIGGLKIFEPFDNLIEVTSKWLTTGAKLAEPQRAVTLPSEKINEAEGFEA